MCSRKDETQEFPPIDSSSLPNQHHNPDELRRWEAFGHASDKLADLLKELSYEFTEPNLISNYNLEVSNLENGTKNLLERFISSYIDFYTNSFVSDYRPKGSIPAIFSYDSVQSFFQLDQNSHYYEVVNLFFKQSSNLSDTLRMIPLIDRLHFINALTNNLASRVTSNPGLTSAIRHEHKIGTLISLLSIHIHKKNRGITVNTGDLIPVFAIYGRIFLRSTFVINPDLLVPNKKHSFHNLFGNSFILTDQGESIISIMYTPHDESNNRKWLKELDIILTGENALRFHVLINEMVINSLKAMLDMRLDPQISLIFSINHSGDDFKRGPVLNVEVINLATQPIGRRGETTTNVSTQKGRTLFKDLDATHDLRQNANPDVKGLFLTTQTAQIPILWPPIEG